MSGKQMDVIIHVKHLVGRATNDSLSSPDIAANSAVVDFVNMQQDGYALVCVLPRMHCLLLCQVDHLGFGAPKLAGWDEIAELRPHPTNLPRCPQVYHAARPQGHQAEIPHRGHAHPAAIIECTWWECGWVAVSNHRSP